MESEGVPAGVQHSSLQGIGGLEVVLLAASGDHGGLVSGDGGVQYLCHYLDWERTFNLEHTCLTNPEKCALSCKFLEKEGMKMRRS
ncbi:hypothetical protein E2C01_033299 [Portunus trituberculatus]|uniref:Uncharacterized protein n=1 Tax=Portunus trituberculatus TaxID=210409 RepID=A0A5B7EYC4_PORTR|nr:hypothetical protein [Portunus trituberculatus]